MKHLILVLGITAICYSCGQKSDTASVEETEGLSGTFVSPKGDTLKIVKDEDAISNEIGFDIVAQTEEQWKTVFNDAPFVESTDEIEKYQFQDSSEYTFEDLVFTYSYTDDTWKIDDLISQYERDSTRIIDLSGIFKRIE